MNVKMILHMLGNVLRVEAWLMMVPFVVGLHYTEDETFTFLFVSLVLLAINMVIKRIKVENRVFFAREGFIIVALSWILMSIAGAFPFYLSGAIPSYVDALFEIVSGFTTTGSSILQEIESLPRCMLFWRSFTHWVGGMGVLVFIMSILPLAANDRSMHVMRAESPGPMVGKLVPKIRNTASLLYSIYFLLTAILIVLLILGGMPIFDAFCHAFGTAGTGGFSILNQSIGQYNNLYFEIIIGIFMVLFGINFNMYYFLLIKDVKSVFKNEELRWYLGVIAIATILITLNLIPYYQSVLSSLRYAFFQVSSIITTTGYSSVDFNLWPQFSKTIIIFLMFLGASAGSTGGGMKVSRLIIIIKKIRITVIKMIHPRSVKIVRLDGKKVEDSTVNEVFVFFCTYMLILAIAILLISLDGFDWEVTSTAVINCLGNIGPGFGIIGPMGNFSAFSNFSKIILTLCMLFGRLEIFPMLLALTPNVYHQKSNDF